MTQATLPFKAVVFDLDGTLLDTAGDYAAAANAMLEELQLPCLETDLIKTFIGNGIRMLVTRSLRASQASAPDPEQVTQGLAVFERHYADLLTAETQIYDGVTEGLRQLRQKGLLLGCITNKYQKFTYPLLRRTGLLDYFTLVLSGDSLPQQKPHPAPLLHACRYFAVEPRHLLMIGDSANDTQAARAAGCPVFCVPYGYSAGLDIRELDHDGVITSIHEAAKRIVAA